MLATFKGAQCQHEKSSEEAVKAGTFSVPAKEFPRSYCSSVLLLEGGEAWLPQPGCNQEAINGGEDINGKNNPMDVSF